MGLRERATALVAGAALTGSLLAACGATPSGPLGSRPTTTTPPNAAATMPAPQTHFAAGGCPVGDAAFCARAADAANALVAGDVDALMSLAGTETFTCDEMPAGMVANCRPGLVLRGVATFAVETQMTVAALAEFRQRLGDTLARTDAAYTDDHGTGRLTVRGVGTCGPADPQRRSYHLAFTVALRGDGATSERWLGSLEFAVRDGVWVFGPMYLDTVAHWRTEHTDPFRQTACGNVAAWRPA